MILNYLKYTGYIIPKKQWYKPIFFTFIILFFIIPVNAEIFTNGGFETGDFTGWSFGSYASTVTSNVHSDYSYDSNYGTRLYASGTSCAIWMYQTIDLTDIDNFTFRYKNVAVSGNEFAKTYVYIDGSCIYIDYNAGDWILKEIDTSGYSGNHVFYFYCSAGAGTTEVYLDNFDVIGTLPASGDLYIGGLDNSFCSSNQNWYVNDTKYSGIDVYFTELVDYKIDNFDTSKEYFINCSSSNESWDYDYFKILINDRGGNSFDDSGIQRVSSMTNILYPDEPTTYTFGLYELSEPISEHFPWYYWLLYPLYMLIDWFAEDEGTTVTEIDTIEIRLSRVSGDNETEPDFPESPEQPDIPDPETEPEDPINWTTPEEPPTYEGANQTINLTWVEGYYTNVNNTIEGLYSPIYNFTNWSLTPITSLTSSITDFNTEMDKSFLQSKTDSEGLYSSFNTIITAIHPKIINVISYYLIWLILLLILRKR